MKRFIFTTLFGMVLGCGATIYYYYITYADPTEQALMRDTLLAYAPFLAEYINP